MYINWPIIIIVALVILALLVFVIINNRRDRKKLEEQLNQNYPKPKKAHTEEDPEDIKQG